MSDKPDLKPSGWDAPPLPLPGYHRRPTQPQQLGIRHIMISLVYFAILFALGREAMVHAGWLRWVWVGLTIGSGLAGVGVWMALAWPRYSWVGWAVFVIGYAFVMGSTMHVFAIPTIPILIGSIIYLQYRKRTTNQDAMLGVLAVAAESGIPLAPGVWAFSEQVRGMFEVWASSLGVMLMRGMSLPDAIEGVPKVVPKGALILIRVGGECGRLGSGLRESILVRTKQAPLFREIGSRICYLLWVIFVGQFVVGFVLYFIIPKFEAIFRDFGTSLPPVTIFVIQASHFVVERSAIFFLVETAVVILSIFLIVGSAVMNIPGVDWIFRRRHSGLIFRALAITVESGRPVGPVLYSMGRWYPTRWVAHDLDQAGELAAQGTDWVEALRLVRLVKPSDAGMLYAASRAGNLPWALRELAETGERRWGYQVRAWSQFLFVLAMLILGSTVLVIALAYFLPLVNLIEKLSR